jgi:small GTP-binding protein
LPRPAQLPAPAAQPPTQIQYTNAKVVLVGESGAGKTGLAERLALDTFTPSYSTAGAWATQWHMEDLPPDPSLERDVWLWDFGGQADQRLVQQLYLDNAALVLLVFDADDDDVLPHLREWQQALSRTVSKHTRTILVAGRIDGGFRFDREEVRAFAEQHGYGYFETSAIDGRGCDELRRAIQTGIPWAQLERRTSPATWNLVRNEIVRLRDEGSVLFTFKELREELRQRLAGDARFEDADLDTVISLLDAPNIVKELGFGSFVLLRPEWLNAYAQAVIRTIRAADPCVGVLPVQSIAEGRLIFQTVQAGGEVVDEQRLGKREEPIVLQAMEQMLLDRKLCLRQGGNLVFPSYSGIQRTGPTSGRYFISYVFSGYLDDIYSTLVAKLAYCGAFKLKEIWRDAADFSTLSGQTMGVKLQRNLDGQGTLLIHFSKAVAPPEQVIFANYIHEHLLEKASQARRLRLYVCEHCDTPVADTEEAARRLAQDGKKASILCVRCEKRVPLWDALEGRFASEATKRAVVALQRQERFTLDTRRMGKLLALEVAARFTSADQKCHEIPQTDDEGIDMVVEFTDDHGRGTGKHVYLQLKCGNSHLTRRAHDEVFRIKKQNWVQCWIKQDSPVLLVIGTLPDPAGPRTERPERFADIRWMEIRDLLRRESDDGTRRVTQIVFKGERLDAMSVRRLRDRIIGHTRVGAASLAGRKAARRA